MRRAGEKGFLLVELIITLGLLIMVLGAIFYIYEGYIKTFNSTQAQVSVTESARVAMNEIQNYTREATQVLNSYVFSGTAYSSGPNVLVLALPSKNSSGDVISGKSDYAVFYVSGKKLYRLSQPDASSARTGGSRQLTDQLGSLTFTYNNGDFTQVSNIIADLQTQTQVRGQTIKTRIEEQINLKNH